MILRGDCVELMKGMDECSVDAVVCDPPYLLGFMGKEFDSQHRGFRRAENPADVGRDSVFGRTSATSPEYVGEGRAMQEWHQAWATEALRVLKPGGHLLAFGGSRTSHRLACAIEDAGFEIRDTIAWMYGSGFPKSLDVSKAIDKAAGAEREKIGDGKGAGTEGNTFPLAPEYDLTAPATPEAQQWQGWGTALKPSHEPVVVARKPLSGTVAQNVLEFGAGAINVDGCRIGTDRITAHGGGQNEPGSRTYGMGSGLPAIEAGANEHFGRWPANVVLDEQAAELLDEQTGGLTSGNRRAGEYRRLGGDGRYGEWDEGPMPAIEGDSRGASRFFYTAKSSRAERNAGLEGFEERNERWNAGPLQDHGIESGTGRIIRRLPRANVHPTVKPISLMRWLVRLVTPSNGTVLDPFAGSGTTGIACVLEGFDFIGIEREDEYADIAEARIAWWTKHRGEGTVEELLTAAKDRDENQTSLFEEENK